MLETMAETLAETLAETMAEIWAEILAETQAETSLESPDQKATLETPIFVSGQGAETRILGALHGILHSGD